MKKQVLKLKSKFYKRSGGYGSQSNREVNNSNSSRFGSSSLYTHKRKDVDKSDSQSLRSDRSFRCHECESFEHYQAKCPTFLKRKKNSFFVTLSNEESSSDSDGENFGRALISCVSKKEFEVSDIESVLKSEGMKANASQLKYNELLMGRRSRGSETSEGENTALLEDNYRLM